MSCLGANGDVASLNLFAYCGNNPISRKDSEGNFWNIVAGVVAGAVISAVSQIITNVATGNEWSSGVILAAAGGALSGGLAATGLGKTGQMIGNAIISGGSEIVNQISQYKNDKENFNLGKAVLSVAGATVSGVVSGAIGGDGMRVKGSDYKYALDGVKTITNRITNGVYSNGATELKLLYNAFARVYETGKKATLQTAAKFFAGAQVAQHGMARLNAWLD